MADDGARPLLVKTSCQLYKVLSRLFVMPSTVQTWLVPGRATDSWLSSMVQDRPCLSAGGGQMGSATGDCVWLLLLPLTRSSPVEIARCSCRLSFSSDRTSSAGQFVATSAGALPG